MKTLLLVAVLLLTFLSFLDAQSNSEKITNLVSGIINVGETAIPESSAIAAISQLAAEQAETTIEFNKENVVEAFSKGQDYSKAIIIVNQHTIVKITNWADCIASGAWETCMPKGEGFVSSGGLTAKNDYINNIIGTSENQKRILYLFK
jgi:hypothetical protein